LAADDLAPISTFFGMAQPVQRALLLLFMLHHARAHHRTPSLPVRERGSKLQSRLQSDPYPQTTGGNTGLKTVAQPGKPWVISSSEHEILARLENTDLLVSLLIQSPDIRKRGRSDLYSRTAMPPSDPFRTFSMLVIVLGGNSFCCVSFISAFRRMFRRRNANCGGCQAACSSAA
jgi:hypothetical protein